MNIPDGVSINQVPPLIQYLWAASYMNHGIGLKMYEEAIQKYPEYFVEELEARRKWAIVPDDIKKQHFEEGYEAISEIQKECHVKAGGSGILYWLEHPYEMDAHMECLASKRLEINRVRMHFHKKYLAKYGIEFVKQ